MKNKRIGKVQSKRSKKQWNVKMNRKKLALIFFLTLIPILILSLHIISNEIQSDLISAFWNYDVKHYFFGVEISLDLLYDIILYLVIFISIICAMSFLMGNKKKVRRH